MSEGYTDVGGKAEGEEEVKAVCFVETLEQVQERAGFTYCNIHSDGLIDRARTCNSRVDI